MSRQIYFIPEVQADKKSIIDELPVQTESNDYQIRVMKLLPADIVAVYLSLKSIIEAAKPDSIAFLWGLFVLVLIISPFYIKNVTKVNDWKQILLLVIAFVIWAFSLGQPFLSVTADATLIGAILLGVFTLITPMVYKGVSHP